VLGRGAASDPEWLLELSAARGALCHGARQVPEPRKV